MTNLHAAQERTGAELDRCLDYANLDKLSKAIRAHEASVQATDGHYSLSRRLAALQYLFLAVETVHMTVAEWRSADEATR